MKDKDRECYFRIPRTPFRVQLILYAKSIGNLRWLKPLSWSYAIGGWRLGFIFYTQS